MPAPVVGTSLLVPFLVGGGKGPTPVPGRLLQTEPRVSYIFRSLMKPETLLAYLPLNNPTFSVVLNGAGSWSASLNVEDLNVRKSNWVRAVSPWRSALWIDVEDKATGQHKIIGGGPVTGAPYSESEGKVSPTGTTFFGYLARRTQNGSYTELTDPTTGQVWSEEPGVAAQRIVYTLLYEALKKAGPAGEEELAKAELKAKASVPINVVCVPPLNQTVRPPSEGAKGEPTPEEFFITFSAPATQSQTLATMLEQIHQLALGVGVDIRESWAYSDDGVPEVSLEICYERAGAGWDEEGNTGLVVLSKLDLAWEWEGAEMSNSVIEQVGGSGSESVETTNTQGLYLGDGSVEEEKEEYPILEQVVSHASVSPTTQSEAVLKRYAQSDLAQFSYPLTTPVETLPMFGSPSIVDLLQNFGENVRLVVPRSAGELLQSNPRFPDGLDTTVLRPVQIDASIPDQGAPTMEVTFNVQPFADDEGNAIPPSEYEGPAS